MIIRKCLVCKKEFKVYPSMIKKLCSPQCVGISKKGSKQSKETCEKKRKIAIKLNYGERLIHNKGNKSPSWRGGTSKKDGYIFVFRPGFADVGPNGYIREHRYIAEITLGRYLSSDEIVHHINGKRDDNRLENLYLFSSIKEHVNFHLKPHDLISNIKK